MYIMPEGTAFTNQIQTEQMCYNCFVLWCMSGSDTPLACVWHEQQFFTVGLVHGMAWVVQLMESFGFSCSLAGMDLPLDLHNLPCVRILYTNIPLMLLTSSLLALYVQRTLCTMDNHTYTALQHLSARPKWSIVNLSMTWLVQISIITITEANGT